jgi:hypothetical protein
MRYIPEHIRTDEFYLELIINSDSYLSFDRIKISKPMTEETWRKLIRNNANALVVIPEEQITFELCVEALLKDEYSSSSILKYVPNKFKTYDFCFNCVRIDGTYLENVPESLKTYELCFEAISENGYALKHVPPHLLTEEMILAAANRSYDALEYVPVRLKTDKINQYAKLNEKRAFKNMTTEDIINAFLIKDEFMDVPEELRNDEFWRNALSESGHLLKKVPMSQLTEEYCRLAIKNDGKALEFVPDKFMTKELCFAAVKQNSHALKYVDVGKLTENEYAEICRLAFEGS